MSDELMTEWPSPSTPLPSTLPDTEPAPAASPSRPVDPAVTGWSGDDAHPIAAGFDAARDLVDRVGRADALDVAVDRLRDLLGRVPADVRGALQGRWLGHPLHPALTDVAIGCWTSATVVDLVGGRRGARSATALVGLGVVAAAPTAAAGWADWTELPRRKQRVGIVHAVSNVLATIIYARSYGARRAGHRGAGVFFGLLGAAVATVGGYLGGHLAFGEDDDTEER